jgi:DNA-binding response OmpR family regulator
MNEQDNILLVEDESAIQELLVEILMDMGFNCTCALSCADARVALQSDAFVCALIDLGLPDASGLTLLPDFKSKAPWMIPIILTGDGRSETIIETMRAGAFDFLTKPVGVEALRASVQRAVEHHKVIRERDTLVELLSQEREQLKAKIAEATTDIRQYAAEIELTSERRQSLLHLTQLSTDFYSDEDLFRSVFEELEKYGPISCVALRSSAQDEFLAALKEDSDEEIHVIVVDGTSGDKGAEHHDLPKSDDLNVAFKAQTTQYTGLITEGLRLKLYPQVFWGCEICTVAFFFPKGSEEDDAQNKFFDMCAYFTAIKWQEARLSLHLTQQASLGNIALEIIRGFIQSLTAIRTTTDYVSEISDSKDARDGLGIICDNVDHLKNQIQEFRQLSSRRKDSVETVNLDKYIEQALDMLSMSIQSRGIRIEKDFQSDCECVLLNGTALARTFLDLITSAVQSVEAGGCVTLRLQDKEEDFLTFEICHDSNLARPFGVTLTSEGLSEREQIVGHPRFLMAQWTIQSCGGKLSLTQEGDSTSLFRIVLPKNAIRPGDAHKVTR